MKRREKERAHHDALYDLLGCCPGEPYVPVGGEITPNSQHLLSISSLFIVTVSVLMGYNVYEKKKVG